jgi:dTDP-4-dehydrorhamnose 3,5-epimerase
VIFHATSLEGAYLIDIEPVEDERGHFARLMCSTEFDEHGLVGTFVQTSQSYNRRRGTLRGMHFQYPPHEEVKLVRCVQGAIYDVILDLRPDSPTYKRWEGFELSLANGRGLYIPKGFAHGFITLADETYVNYQISHPYTPGSAGGLRYDDPSLGIVWPEPVTVISERDKAWPLAGTRSVLETVP